MNAAARATAATLCLAAATAAGALIRLPYLQNVGENHAVIIWATPAEVSGAVEYASEGGDRRVSNATVREFAPAETGLASVYYQHTAHLTGLEPGTLYSYRILSDGVEIEPAGPRRFRTAGRGPFKFFAFGDSGTGSPEQLRLAARMTVEQDVDFVLHTGDIAYQRGSFSEFEAFHFKPYAQLMGRVPFFPTPGNHEYYTERAAPYLALHTPPASDVPAADSGRYYSFDWGDAHFLSIDSNLLPTASAGEMLSWIENDLARTRRYWKIAYFHHAPYPGGHHVGDSIAALVRERLIPILERHGVQLVLCAHEHSYQRTLPLEGGKPVGADRGIFYVVTAGGGAILHNIGESSVRAFGSSEHHYVRVDVAAGRLTITAIGLEGQAIDSVTLNPGPQVRGGALNAASYTADLAPGSLFSVFGRNLAFTHERASAFPLPGKLAATSLTVGGRPVPLLFASPTQINAQLPYDIDIGGEIALRLENPNGSASLPIPVQEVAPAILSLHGGPAIVHPTGQLVRSETPARPLEPVIIYLVGMGALDRYTAAGHAASESSSLHVSCTVEVRIGDERARVLFAGLTPGFAGLYQINVEIPRGLAPGEHDLRVLARGVASNTVQLMSAAAAPAE